MNFDDGVNFEWGSDSELHEGDYLKTDASSNLDRYSKSILLKALDHEQGLFQHVASRHKEKKALNILISEGLITEVPNLSNKFPDLYQPTQKGFNTLKAIRS
jgi:hypothetical protein